MISAIIGWNAYEILYTILYLLLKRPTDSPLGTNDAVATICHILSMFIHGCLVHGLRKEKSTKSKYYLPWTLVWLFSMLGGLIYLGIIQPLHYAQYKGK